jgi:hypothetical protein
MYDFAVQHRSAFLLYVYVLSLMKTRQQANLDSNGITAKTHYKNALQNRTRKRT